MASTSSKGRRANLSESIHSLVEKPLLKLGNEISDKHLSKEFQNAFEGMLNALGELLSADKTLTQKPFALWIAITKDLSFRASQLRTVFVQEHFIESFFSCFFLPLMYQIVISRRRADLGKPFVQVSFCYDEVFASND